MSATKETNGGEAANMEHSGFFKAHEDLRQAGKTITELDLRIESFQIRDLRGAPPAHEHFII
jgi:hypothetical protein